MSREDIIICSWSLGMNRGTRCKGVEEDKMAIDGPQQRVTVAAEEVNKDVLKKH